MKLGVGDIIKISAARQAYGCAKTRFEKKHLSQDLGDIFGLEGSSEAQIVGPETDENESIKSLEGEVSDAQAAFIALPAVVTGSNYCTSNYGSCAYDNNGYCRRCEESKPAETAERRLKREEKEEKEQRLKDLTDKRQEKLAKKERMALFRC